MPASHHATLSVAGGLCAAAGCYCSKSEAGPFVLWSNFTPNLRAKKKKTALERQWCRWEVATATLCEVAVRHPLPAPCRAHGVTVTEVPLAAAQWCSSGRNQSWGTATPQRPLGMALELCVCVCCVHAHTCAHAEQQLSKAVGARALLSGGQTKRGLLTQPWDPGGPSSRPRTGAS